MQQLLREPNRLDEDDVGNILPEQARKIDVLAADISGGRESAGVLERPGVSQAGSAPYAMSTDETPLKPRLWSVREAEKHC